MLLTAVLLLIASQLPMVASGIAKAGSFRAAENRYDNHEPRLWLERQTDPRRRRANAAQANSFEALPFLFAAAMFALILHAPTGLIDGLLIAWLVLRAVYLWCYITDRPTVRSLAWTLALVVNIVLLFAPLHG
jgi:uncharacterized MAPEG superfamily protein